MPINALSDYELKVLLQEADSFFLNGHLPDDAKMRTLTTEVGLQNNAVGLFHLSHILFREYYVRANIKAQGD